jgi:hypothetical protein
MPSPSSFCAAVPIEFLRKRTRTDAFSLAAVRWSHR